MTTRLHTCTLCEAACGLAVEVEAGRVRSVRGDALDPFSRGHVCPKAAALPDVIEDPDRIREPLRRVGDRFEPVSWKVALDEIGGRLAAIRKRHGCNAVGVYLGNPSVHSLGAMIGLQLFGHALGTRAQFSATSLDQLPQMLAALEVLGHQLRLPIPDVDRTQFLLIIGANPLASNGSLMTAPGIRARLEALRARGGRLVVVDPRRTETADMADLHLPIRPGTDALLLLAMIQVLFAEGLVALGRLAAFTDGLETLREAASRFTPERVAPRTGIAAETIRTLARDFAASPSAVAYGRVGACTQEFGGLTAWLLLALDVVTGNLDREGGAMLTRPAADVTKLGRRGHFALWRSRVRGLPEFGGELPAATLAEELDTPGEGQVRGLMTFAGNPVLSSPNGARLERALAGLECFVAVDIYRNETTRYAHFILPTPVGLERDHYDLVFYLLSVRNAARYVRAAVPPPPGVRGELELLVDLALAIRKHGGGRPGLRGGLSLRLARLLGERRLLDRLLRAGPYRRSHGMSLATLVANPHGMDLGPLVPALPERLATPDRRLHLAPPLFVADLARLEATLAAPAPAGLVLIGRRELRSNNSWMHNSRRLVKGPARCVLMMSPEDARAHGVSEGDRVRVSSRVGSVVVPVEVTTEVAAGVVCLPHGYGHDRPGTALGVARDAAGASINDLTDEAQVDALSGTAVLSGVPVSVARA
jgi:anaerobic selenocysteine-containing dehydrogenase